MTRFFDTHCDTVMRHFEAGHDFVNGVGSAHLDLPRMLEAGHRAQVFAVFTAQGYFPGGDVTAYAEQAIAVIHGWEAAAGGRLRIVRGRADLTSAQLHDSVAALIGLEGADPLDGDPENLAYFFDLGVRLVIPAWDDNAFSGAATGSGGPLTEAGIRLIELAEALGIMVDVSHLSDRGFEQLCVLATRPFIASHSNCRALCPSPRNLTDEQIHTIADRGGAIGVNLATDFLSPDFLAAWNAVMAPVAGLSAAARQRFREAAGDHLRAIPLPEVTWVARHVQHLIRVGGEDCAGLGGDLDGIGFMPAGMTGIESYPAIADALVKAGLTPRQMDKVCWQNMLRVFTDVLM